MGITYAEILVENLFVKRKIDIEALVNSADRCDDLWWRGGRDDLEDVCSSP